MQVWGGRVYATGCNMVTGIEIWEYDGMNWVQVNDDGFGDAHNTMGPAMTAYNGNLYVTTTNSATGCEVWKYDGSDWTQVNEDGFGDEKNGWGFSMSVLRDKLYVGTGPFRIFPHLGTSGCKVWEYDGSDWTLVNTPGFGDANNYTAFSMISFFGNLYVGTRNLVTGCDLWKMSYDLAGDINGDGRIGLEEAIHALQVVSGVKSP